MSCICLCVCVGLKSFVHFTKIFSWFPIPTFASSTVLQHLVFAFAVVCWEGFLLIATDIFCILELIVCKCFSIDLWIVYLQSEMFFIIVAYLHFLLTLNWLLIDILITLINKIARSRVYVCVCGVTIQFVHIIFLDRMFNQKLCKFIFWNL